MTLVPLSEAPTTRINGRRFVHFGKMAGISMRYVKAQSAVVWIRQNDCRTRTCQEAGVLVEGPWRVNCFFWLTTRQLFTPSLLPCYFAVLVS